ncbi:transposase DNA-binding-containing protein [Symbiopectobacterium sp. Eva_TO]
MTRDSDGWAHQELEGVNLGDTRLNKRAKGLLITSLYTSLFVPERA